MNRRVCVRIGSVLSVAVCGQAVGGLGVQPAMGQARPPAPSGAPAQPPPPPPLPLPPAMRAAQSAANAQPAESAIASYIKASLDRVADPAPVVSHVGRKQLVDGCPRGVTASYRNLYADQLAKQAAGRIDPAKVSMRDRLGVALAVEYVAPNADSTALVPITVQLLDDPSPAVALHAMKAARPLVMTLITQPNGPGKTPLFDAIVRSVDTHHADKSAAGYLAVEAYAALAVRPQSLPANVPATVLLPLYDPTLDLVEKRTAWYADGMVPAPDAERVVGTFLTANNPALTPTQKGRIEQDLVNLLANIAYRVTTTTDRTEINAARETVVNSASALNVLSGSTTAPPLAAVTRLALGVTGPVMSSTILGAQGLPALQGSMQNAKIPPPLPPLPEPTPAGTPAPGAPTASPPPPSSSAGGGNI